MFVLDQGVKKSIEVARLLKEVLPSPPQSHAEEIPLEEHANEPASHGYDDEQSGAETPKSRSRARRPR
jgi:hypothetical protein